LGEFFLLAFVQIVLESKHEIEGLIDPSNFVRNKKNFLVLDGLLKY